jgi:hypothetical protein
LVNQRWLLAALHLCLFFPLSGAVASADEEPTTADQVIARYMEAIGADRFSFITTFAEQGEISGNLSVRESERANFEFYFKSPNLRFSSTVSSKNKLIGSRGCDGRIAWYIDMNLKRTELTPKPGKELDCEKGYEPMPSHLRDPETKTRLAKKKEIQGRMAWEVIVDNHKLHEHAKYYFDAETYVLLRIQSEGSHVAYSDYREIGGFKFPFKTTSEHAASKVETTVREIVINGPIDDARFDEPTVKNGSVILHGAGAPKKPETQVPISDSPKTTTAANEPATSDNTPPRSTPTPKQTSITEVNFPNFTLCSIAELQQTVPELKGLKPAPDQHELAALLERVGAKTAEIARNTPNLISHETVTDLGKGAAAMRYDYLILNRIDGNSVYLDEFRVDLRTGEKFQTDEEMKKLSSQRAALERASQDLAASQAGRRPVSQGFASSWVHFYPRNLPQAVFRYLGEQKMEGHRTLVLAFAQKPELVTSPVRFLYGGKNVPVFLQGLAWVDASDFHIWRLRTDLLSPLMEVSLHRLTADIQFKPTRVEEISSLISLPREVKVTSVVSGSTTQETHSYSEYRLFRARSKIVLNP